MFVSIKRSVRKFIFRIFDIMVFFRYSWLREAKKIESHLTSLERYHLFKYAVNRKNIVEVGSYLGASAYSFGVSASGSMKQSKDVKIVCIDTWQNHAMSEGIRDTFISFTKNVEPFAEYIVPIRGFSSEVYKEVLAEVENIDLLFLDGDHSYEGVLSDWVTYSKHLNRDAFVILHDIGWADGVKRVLEEEILSVCVPVRRLPNLWIGRKV